MHRAPATNSTATGFLMLMFLVFGALYFSGCTDSPSDLGFDEMPPMEDMEIGTVISERQQHLLDTAERLAAASAKAYQNGHFRRAIILGHKAVGVSLTAVIRPDRVTDNRIRALTDVANSEFQVLIDLAEAELAAARAALELEPNEFFEKLLKRAVMAFETGVDHLRNGNPRGIQLIWRAAVVGAVIAG